MDPVAASVTVFATIVFLLLPFEASNLRRRAVSERLSLSRSCAALIALLDILLSLSLGILCFCLVMFGPAYLLGDVAAMPWLTFIPALIAGFWTARFINFRIAAFAFGRLDPAA